LMCIFSAVLANICTCSVMRQTASWWCAKMCLSRVTKCWFSAMVFGQGLHSRSLIESMWRLITSRIPAVSAKSGGKAWRPTAEPSGYATRDAGTQHVLVDGLGQGPFSRGSPLFVALPAQRSSEAASVHAARTGTAVYAAH